MSAVFVFNNQNRPGCRRGFTLLETVFALAVFAMMALLFSAALPVSERAARVNAQYAQAAALAQHKIAQVRAAGFTALQNPATLSALGVIDSGATSQAVPYTASFLASDHLLADSSGSGLFAPGATATMTVADYASANAAVPAGTVDIVTVQLSWPPGTTSSGTFAMSGLVIQMPHS